MTFLRLTLVLLTCFASIPTAHAAEDWTGPDPAARKRLIATFGAGAGGELAFQTPTGLVDATLGFRINDPLKTTRFLLLGGATYASVHNFLADETEETSRRLYAEVGEPGVVPRIDVADTTHLVAVGLGIGLEAGNQPVVSFGGIRLGFAFPPGGECVAWRTDAAAQATGCADRKAILSPAVHAQLGVRFRMFYVAAHSLLMPRKHDVLRYDEDSNQTGTQELSKTLVVGGATLGIALDF